MEFITTHKAISFVILVLILLFVVGLSNFLYVRFSGSNVSAPEIPRDRTSVGSGEELKLLVLGDSTSIAQGADYDEGYVVGSTNKLSENYKVIHQNFGVSGAVIRDVAKDQLNSSSDFIPDIALVAVGANDVTHLTSLDSIKRDTQKTIDKLKLRNSNVKIVFTGAASMGDVKRLGYPLRWLAGFRTRQINDVMENVVNANENVSFAYIARETGAQFAQKGDEYLAADKFHPNAKGYELWTEVITNSLQESLQYKSN